MSENAEQTPEMPNEEEPVVANNLGRNAILIELNSNYISIINKRLESNI